MNWMDYSLQEFQDALASSDPTPGGGTAAAADSRDERAAGRACAPGCHHAGLDISVLCSAHAIDASHPTILTGRSAIM